MLKQYKALSSSNNNNNNNNNNNLAALKTDFESKQDGEDDEAARAALADDIEGVLLRSIVQDNGDLLLATMMEGDEKEAVAQARFFRRLIDRIRNSPLGRFIGDRIRKRLGESGTTGK